MCDCVSCYVHILLDTVVLLYVFSYCSHLGAYVKMQFMPIFMLTCGAACVAELVIDISKYTLYFDLLIYSEYLYDTS